MKKLGLIINPMAGKLAKLFLQGKTRRTVDCEVMDIDVVHNKKLIAQDLNELQLLNIINGKKCKLIITPIGGQGYILGRGNQQLSPDVLKVIGKDHVIIAATARKIDSLRNRSLLVDTGDRETDLILSDYFRIVTGCHESRVYKVTRLVE